MKAVILAGGLGTRLAEETGTKPKPMVEAGGRPLIWHIMSNYARAGVTDFLVLAGYKGDVIREYFANFWLHQADVTFDLGSSRFEVRANRATPWSVTVLDTGQHTMTGGRLARAREYLPSTFFLTYGDGVSDVDVSATLESHRSNQGAMVTLTAMRPPARFGALQIEGSKVQGFQEKPSGDGTWVNGGYFVMEPEIFNLLGDDGCVLERDVLPALATEGKLGCYKHSGTFQPVDTVRDLAALEGAILEKAFPWT
jgi:glucose-1-phosphate cytidylyltransferase